MMKKLVSLLIVTLVWSFQFVPAQAAFHDLGTNIVTSGGTVYTITTENGQTVRRPYTSAGAYLSYGFNSWSNAIPASSDDSLLPVGSFIPPQDGKIICSDRGNDKGTCYLISQGTKIGFPSEQIFKAQGFTFSNVLSGDTSFLSYPSNISSGNEAHKAGVLINLNGTVYLVGPNGLLGFPDVNIFDSWTYSFANVITANAADSLLPIAGVIQSKNRGQLSAFTPFASGFSFSASLSSLNSPIVVSGDATNQRIASFNLSVGAASKVSLNSISLQTASNNVVGNFKNLRVVVNGTAYDAAVSSPNNGSAYSFTSYNAPVLTAGQLSPVEVYADISANISVNQPIIYLSAVQGSYVNNGSIVNALTGPLTGQTVMTTVVQTTSSIQISNITMPNGVVGQSYTGAIGWSAPNISPTTDITAIIDRVGSNNYPYPYFPDGLTLSPNCLAGAPGSSCVFSGLKNNSNGQGQISFGGTPTQAGTYTFTITFRESQYNTTDTKTINLTIAPASNLTFSLSGGNTTSVSANNSNQIIGAFVLTNNSANTVNFGGLTVQMANSNITGNFQNLKLFVAGVQVGASQSTATPYNGSTYTFNTQGPAGGVPVNINPQTSVLVTITADLPSVVHYSNGQSLLTVSGITAAWQNSGQATPQLPSLAGQIVTVQGASY